MARKWWFTAAAALVTATLYRNRLRAYLEQASANVRAFDLPSARAYDAQVASILEGLGSGSSVLGTSGLMAYIGWGQLKPYVTSEERPDEKQN
jgi:hypothetical protein